MRIGGTEKAALGGRAAPDGVTPARESRALVPLAPAATAHERPAPYREAPFLAHLLAVKHQHAQTRERRRAAPSEAIAAYRAAAGLIL
jgi:hypothetical protein